VSNSIVPKLRRLIELAVRRHCLGRGLEGREGREGSSWSLLKSRKVMSASSDWELGLVLGEEASSSKRYELGLFWSSSSSDVLGVRGYGIEDVDAFERVGE